MVNATEQIVNNSVLPLMSHLLRRAAFGATAGELERYASQGYKATVEQLLHPETAPELDEDVQRRYNLDQNSLMLIESSQANWMYRIINTQRPLEEKIALFWHGIFSTAYGKLNHAKAVVNQTNTFRRHGLGNFRTLLLELARDPAMIFWLDNQNNHKGAPNENFGRELLELFSLGLGSYTEDDVKNCARAFTGWTIANADYMSIRASRDSIWPHGRLDWQFQYQPNDHDDSPKSFLGHTGRFNGEDIIDVICSQPDTAKFVARHLYNFFVADEPPVPSWSDTAPHNPEAVQLLADEYLRTNGNIRCMLRLLFNAQFFTENRLARVKSPTELVAGTARLAGSHQFPDWSIVNLAMDVNFMGQEILNPPSVEGWHTGSEWIDTGNLVERINSAALEIGNINLPGVRDIIGKVRNTGDTLTPRQFVDACLKAMGLFEVSERTRIHLTAYAERLKDLRFDRPALVSCSEQRIGEMLQLIVATREYQLT